MKRLKLICGVAGTLLLTAACSAPAPNANTTASSNAANRNAAPAANTAASNTAAGNANSGSANSGSANSGSGSAQQDGSAQDFTLVNSTGVEIDKVYISPHDKNDWEEDILGKDTLPSGQSVDIKFHRSETAAEWDLRVEDKQGNAIEWENLNLLKISKLTLHYDNGKATAEAE